MLLLSERNINRTIRPLTSKERKDVFIIDDTLFARTGGKKTELCSKVFDHESMKYRRGYRLLTLGVVRREQFPADLRPTPGIQ